MSIVLGWHDVFECEEHEEGHLFGRPYFSFKLFGYGKPPEFDLYRRAILAFEPVIEIRMKLEEVVGPLQQCVYWDL